MNAKHGFTLLELMIVVAVLTIVMGLLSGLALNVQSAAGAQEARIAGQDQVRNATQWLMRELRQATAATLNANAFPVTSITYRRAADLDGNGTAVDAGYSLETTPVRTISRDAADANGDGRRLDQLVMIQGNRVTVLANNLLPDEDTSGNNALNAGEDRNANNVLDRGLLFQQVGGGVQVTIQCMHRPSPREPQQLSTMRFIVVPRN